MSIYNVTYSTVAKQIAPPDKRGNIFTRWYAAFLLPVQWLRDLWFSTYLTGADVFQWSVGTLYTKYNQLLYNKVLYQSNFAGNIGNQPDISPYWWTPVQTNFVGLSERAMYTGQCLTLTYALNKWFGTTFRQPNQHTIISVARVSNVATVGSFAHGFSTGDHVSISGLATAGFNGVWKITSIATNTFTFANTGSNVSTTTDAGIAQKLSDIYILTQANNVSIFRVTRADANSSKTFTDHSTEYVFSDFNFSGLVNMNIYVPAATWAAIAGNDTDRKNIIKNFALQYIPAGIVLGSQQYS